MACRTAAWAAGADSIADQVPSKAQQRRQCTALVPLLSLHGISVNVLYSKDTLKRAATYGPWGGVVTQLVRSPLRVVTQLVRSPCAAGASGFGTPNAYFPVDALVEMNKINNGGTMYGCAARAA